MSRFLVVCWLVGWVCFGWGREASAQPDTAPAFVLHSTEPYQAVYIPFTLRAGTIVVPVTVAGKTLPWVLDTGASDTIWVASPLIADTPGKGFGASQDASGKSHIATTATIARMEIGGYERRQVGGAVMHLTRAEAATVEAKGVPRLLSNTVFAGVVLTIDYAKRELIVRSPDYDPATEASGRGEYAFDFRPLALDSHGNYGWAAVEVLIAGKPLTLAVDTGFSAEKYGIALWQKSYTSLLPALKAQPGFREDKGIANTTTLAGTARQTFTTTSPVPFLIGKAQTGLSPFRASLLIMGTSLPLVDGILGWSVLRDYRVTFDYPRHKLLLEPLKPVRTVTVKPPYSATKGNP